LSPFLNGTKVDFRRSIMRLLANSWAAKASSLFRNNHQEIWGSQI
jgi:hypothetical protein